MRFFSFYLWSSIYILADVGWSEWGEWSQCSVSCRDGHQMRSRFCGEIKGGQVLPENAVWMQKHTENCPEAESSELRECYKGKCLPSSNQYWKTGNQPFKNQHMWSVAKSEFPDKTPKWGADWIGGCTDWNSAYKKINLDSMGQFGKHNQGANFAECIRRCQEEKDRCLSVTFFPTRKNGASEGKDQKKFYGFDINGNELFNCFLHNKRCHEGRADSQRF